MKKLKPSVEVQAQSLEVVDLQTRITQIETQLKTLSLEHSKIKLGGHDIHQQALPVEFLQKVMRDWPTVETKKMADAFEVEQLAPLRKELTNLKARLSTEQVTLGQLRVDFEDANAPQLLSQANERRAEASAALAEAKAHHTTLEKRLNAARMGLLEVDRIKTEYSAAAALAISEGLDVPAMTLPQFEDVKPLEGALALSREKVKGLNETLDSILTHIRSIETRISNRKLGEFMTQLKTTAAAQGVRLEQVRDRLIQDVGPSVSALMDADEVFRLRHELNTLRPEVDKLRQDNRVLQDGITKLTSRSY
jgi:hypothetical protein